MADENALEAVGQAEDVISRLISERRSLENAQQVLRTYRMVKSEMQPALEELAKVKGSVVEERRQLEAVEGQRVNALARVRDEVDRFRSVQMEQVEKELEGKRDGLASLSKEYDGLQEVVNRARKEYTEEIKGYEEQLVKVKGELEQAKVEHSALAEAIGRAAGFFAKESV